MKKHFPFLLLLSASMLSSCVEEPPILMIHTGLVKNITESGAQFNGQIHGAGNAVVQEYGFVWSMAASPMLADYFFRVGTSSFDGEYHHFVQSELLADTIYYVRTYAIHSGITVYGETVSFTSKGSTGPVISSFEPASGSSGAEIVIKGEHFSFTKESNLVRIGDIECEVLSSTSSEITFRIPEVSVAGNFHLSVQVGETTALAAGEFFLEGPFITAIEPHSAVQGTLITINGSGFSAVPSQNIVTFGETLSPVITASSNKLTVKVPPTDFAGPVTVSVEVDGIRGQFGSLFTIEGPEVFSVSPAVDYPGRVLTISGKNFSTVKDQNTVTFDQYFPAAVLSANSTALTVIIPYNLSMGHGGFTYDVDVTVTQKTFTKAGVFTALTPWSELAEFPGRERANAAGFTIDGRGYLGSGTYNGVCHCYMDDFWLFDPESGSWEQKAPMGGGPRGHGLGFSVDGKGYIGGGWRTVDHGYYSNTEVTDDLWEYDTDADQWNQKNNLPVKTSTSHAAIVTVNNTAYLLTESGLYEYQPADDQWIAKAQYPGTIGRNNATIAFELNGKLYASQDALEFYEFSPQSNSWQRKADTPLADSFGYIFFSVGGKGYAGSGNHYYNWPQGHEFYSYDPVKNQWEQIPSTPVSIQNSVVFVIDGVVFYATGEYSYFVQKNVIRFNPNF